MISLIISIYLSHTSLVCSLFIIDPISFIIYHILHFPPLLFAGKVNTVSLFFHIVVRLIINHHRSYIIFLIIQWMLLVDERFLPFLLLKEPMFLSIIFPFNILLIRLQVWCYCNHKFVR